jgi:hypothetical protein
MSATRCCVSDSKKKREYEKKQTAIIKSLRLDAQALNIK